MKRPIIDKMSLFQQQSPISFHVPGHKNGQLSSLPEPLKKALTFDWTELEGLDDLHSPSGMIADAQSLLSDMYSTVASYFLVNGSTSGNLAMIYSVCTSNDLVLVQRNAHQSIFHALQLTGSQPIFVEPSIDPSTQTLGGLTYKQVEESFRKEPSICAVILTYPTYYGVANAEELKKIIDFCKSRAIRILVDEAHGAHFQAHEDFPLSAVSLGADIVVQSAHKTLPAMTMGAYLHISSTNVRREKVEKALQIFQSSSPSYLIMASLDDARHFLSTYSEEDYYHFTSFRLELIEGIHSIPHFEVIEVEDPLKLIIRHRYLSGYALQRELALHQIYCELADDRQTVWVLPLLKKEHQMASQPIIDNLKAVSYEEQKIDKVVQPNFATIFRYNEREMATMKEKWVKIEQAVGQIAAQAITPYPPGIPFILRGQELTTELLNQLVKDSNEQVVFHGGFNSHSQEIAIIEGDE